MGDSPDLTERSVPRSLHVDLALAALPAAHRTRIGVRRRLLRLRQCRTFVLLRALHRPAALGELRLLGPQGAILTAMPRANRSRSLPQACNAAFWLAAAT